MSWGEALENVNYVSVLVATLATLVVGYVWYHPKVFAKDWMKLIGLKEKDLGSKEGMAPLLATSAIFYLLATVTIGALLQLTQMQSAGEGALMGAIVGFVFYFGPLAVAFGYERRRFELALIDGGYTIVALTIAGFILGVWG